MSIINTDAIMKKVYDIFYERVNSMLSNMLNLISYEGRVEKMDLSQVTGSIEKGNDCQASIEFHLEALSEEEKALFKEIFYPNVLIKRKWVYA